MTAARIEAAWIATKSGVEVRVRLTPKADRDAIVGLIATAEGAALKARVRAVPEDGQANAALCVLMAKWLGVPKSDVAVTAGHTSRVKTLAIAGDAAALVRALAQCAG